MPDSSPPSPFRLVLVPVVLTLVVTVLRLVGELQGWYGEAFPQSVVGITWLVPVFGAYFGVRLARSGRGPRSVTAALLVSVAAFAVLIGGMALLFALDLVDMPADTSKGEEPVEPRGAEYMVGVAVLAAATAFAAWPRAAWTNLLYALGARIPVLVVTVVGLSAGWDTHYTTFPDGFVEQEGAALTIALLMPQIVLWIPFTMIVGGLFASLGAALTKPAQGAGKRP